MGNSTVSVIRLRRPQLAHTCPEGQSDNCRPGHSRTGALARSPGADLLDGLARVYHPVRGGDYRAAEHGEALGEAWCPLQGLYTPGSRVDWDATQLGGGGILWAWAARGLHVRKGE